MKKQDNLISVIMPVYNAGHYLEEAVASILNQTNVDLEFILVDDHSTDKAIENLPKKLTKDKRLRIILSHEYGVVAAMAAGYSESKGNYIARMDADDISLPHRLYTQLLYLQENLDVGIVGAKIKIISDEMIDQGFILYQQWLNNLCSAQDIERELFIESPIPNPTAFFRREVYDLLNGYQDSEWAEDYDLWLRAHELGIKMEKPKGILLHWREHERRLTHNDSRYENKLFLKAKAYYLSKSHYFKQRKAIIWGTGPIGTYLHDILTQYDVEVEAFIEVNQRRIGGLKRGLPVLHYSEINKMTMANNALIIGAVGARGARAEIRKALLDMGKQEGCDFLFAA